jgi:pimeloyl-ACP methyl ester carboxylesterase
MFGMTGGVPMPVILFLLVLYFRFVGQNKVSFMKRGICMPKMRVNGTELYYVDEGSGKTLVFIHGLGATHHMFEPQIESFKESYRIICPDTRGNGQSGRLTEPIQTILDRQCDDIAALLDDLKIEKAIFCGVSYGGVFMFHFALRHPKRMAGMVIVDSFSDTKIVGTKEALIMAAQFFGQWTIYMPNAWLIFGLKKLYKKWPLAQKHAVNIVKGLRKHEVVLQRSAINHINHTRKIGTIKCPTLGIVGGNTKVAVRYMKRAMAAIPTSELRVIPNSFDPSNLCQREIFDGLLSEFLSRIGW